MIPVTPNIPGPTDRAVFVGASGSGKTYATRWVLGAYYGERQILIIDTKADPSFDSIDAARVHRSSALGRYRDPERWPVIHYRPAATDMHAEIIDAVCEWAYQRQNTLIAIDEATQVTGGSTRPGPGLLSAVTRGRVRHVSVWSGTQRPVGLPSILLTESEWAYVFALRRKNDRQTIDDYTEDGFAERVLRASIDTPGSHPVGVYHMGHGGEVYPSIQRALSTK